MDVRIPVARQKQRTAGARRLLGLGAIEDHLALLVDDLVRLVQRFGRNPACAGDRIRSRLDVQEGSQIEDHRLARGSEPSLELDRGDPSLSEMTEEALPPRSL